ncbi:hypothetical protein H8356DRAFT_1686460 [Neocallimastix lanati (nom. inval.)]|jgi:hypothetical protein|uniref:SH3 domain-containing protein n=1 Tax=Neocallimastix californiae TaxID=1754190 RepID=A0A1Y2FRA1_9FUNG|nr:hypothetical protein H8356DRAFT_1686460 [Neocallimastix sp. JGI-2020a]ORY85245.1 hypothetical protein LY90DRAFT_697085 [Neocallimastix californiae]|eukprot:ORY85245.1 hypothetical protein LY90DRAFT_697085 [Neocallimastix californiae]
MNRVISILSMSLLLLNSSIVAEKIVHIHINDENNVNSNINGYEMNFSANDENVTTLESSKVSGQAMVDAVNNDSMNISEINGGRNSTSRTAFFLIPIFAMFCIYAVASIGLLIKKRHASKSRPKRRSLHFEDDDELSKILVQTPAATAVGPDATTIRNITQEKSIGKVITNKIFSKKECCFLPINHVYKATLPWNPKHLDEIKLEAGDIVCIKKCYSDGYSYGHNITNRADGIFPTCCISTMEESIDQAVIQDWINYGITEYKKRTTSLYLNDISYKI